VHVCESFKAPFSAIVQYTHVKKTNWTKQNKAIDKPATQNSYIDFGVNQTTLNWLGVEQYFDCLTFNNNTTTLCMAERRLRK